MWSLLVATFALLNGINPCIYNSMNSYELPHNELFHNDEIDLEILREHYLLKRAAELYSKEPNLLRSRDSVIRGQLFDLLGLMKTRGDRSDAQYLFLGVYVGSGYKICLTPFLHFKCNSKLYDLIMNMFDNSPDTFYDLLWTDALDSMDAVHMTKRHLYSYVFDVNATAHKAQFDGYKMQMINEQAQIPNYYDVYKNKRAMNIENILFYITYNGIKTICGIFYDVTISMIMFGILVKAIGMIWMISMAMLALLHFVAGIAVVILVFTREFMSAPGLTIIQPFILWFVAVIIVVLCIKYQLFCGFLSDANENIEKTFVALSMKHTWIMTYLYIMTFGSFIGFSAAFSMLIKDLFPSVNSL